VGGGGLFTGGGGLLVDLSLLVDLGLLVESVGAGQAHLGCLIPAAESARLILPFGSRSGLGMQAPVVEHLGGPVQQMTMAFIFLLR
jgi:hypothetical protein